MPSENKFTPPGLADSFLSWFCRGDLLEEIQGDLHEYYEEELEVYSYWKRNTLYWFHLLNFLRPFAIKKSRSKNSNHYSMFKHNLKLTYRNFLKDKAAFFINLVGLSTGLSCSLLIYLWMQGELVMDKFHENDEHLFQVMENRATSDGIFTTNSTAWPLADALAAEMPEVKYASVATPTYWFERSTLKVGESVIKSQGHYIGNDYFKIFSYEIIRGNKDKLLTDKGSIVISESLAMTLFNTTEDVIGKSITYQQEDEYLVSGIFKDISSESSTQFDFALSIEVLRDIQPQAFKWENAGPMTFIVLDESVDAQTFQEKFRDFIKTKTDDEFRTLLLTKYSHNYLYGRFENGVSVGGQIENIELFGAIAFFILVIACINFMNLSTARISKRMKEIGVKKALGVSRVALIKQYLTESIVLSLLALLVACLAVVLILPQFNVIIGRQLTFDLDLPMAGVLVSIAIATGLLAGSYPALHLSALKPVAIIKGKLPKSFSELWTRKGLVIFQFTFSVMFIVFVTVVYRQIAFVQDKNLGYDKDNVIHFAIEGKLANNLASFLTEVGRLPGVIGASSAAQSMVGGGNTSNITWEGKDPDLVRGFGFRPVNYDYLELMDLNMVEGRSFSREFGDEETVVFNESGIKVMGMENPIGQTIDLGSMKCKIIGVVNDFHYESLRFGVDPMFFILSPENTEKVMVRIEEGNEQQALERIADLYGSFNPGFAFDYRFLDDDYQVQYSQERQVGTLSQYFAFLAIVLSCLGLFGLATFTAERRHKEIGIRKVLGASIFTIVSLLSLDFTKMVLVSIAIALPISYFVAEDWLTGFTYRIPLEWWFFVGAGVMVISIAWLTVGIKTLSAARVDPVNCLSEE